MENILHTAKPAAIVDLSLDEILFAATRLFDDGLYLDGMNLTAGYLTYLRAQVSADDWKNVLIPNARIHPMKRILELDPLTHRCFTWPKGYQGDAETIDYIYYPERFIVEGLGREILNVTIERNAPSAVRSRKEFAKQYLTEKIKQGVNNFVSLGGGYLREWSELKNLDRTIKVASLDSDLESLNVAQKSITHCSFEPIGVHVGSLINGRHFPKNVECIYSLGLFDYLSDAIAKKLIRISIESLAPGGELLLANFSPNTADVGYIEAYMNWFLIYRDIDSLQGLAEATINNQVDQISCWEDESNIVYLKIKKKG